MVPTPSGCVRNTPIGPRWDHSTVAGDGLKLVSNCSGWLFFPGEFSTALSDGRKSTTADLDFFRHRKTTLAHISLQKAEFQFLKPADPHVQRQRMSSQKRRPLVCRIVLGDAVACRGATQTVFLTEKS